jgi:hypothetical protein
MADRYDCYENLANDRDYRERRDRTNVSYIIRNGRNRMELTSGIEVQAGFQETRSS